MRPRALPALLALLLLAVPAVAGGGPESTLVVVNAESPFSRRIANEYVKLRDIPPEHVVLLTGVPHLGVVSLDFAKEKLLGPVRELMEERGIADRIDLIVWSADFPYAVDFRSVLPDPKPGLTIGGQASLTGLTYLMRQVEAGAPFWHLAANRYFRLTGVGIALPPGPEEQKLAEEAQLALRNKDHERAARAFGELVRTYDQSNAVWYNYACALALTGRGDEALAALRRSVATGYRDAAHASADPDLASLRDTPEFRALLAEMQSAGGPRFLPAHGFRSASAWDGGEGPAADGDRYYLSTRLAWTGFKGNSLPEVLGYLRAAAGSDGTKPDGTVYVCRNGDVRSTAREAFFPFLLAGMRKLGRKVEILEKGAGDQTGVLPVGKDDVIGAVVGSAGFGWKSSKSTILPGAILEHLTSFGAHFGTPGQTKLTEFLRHGAAGASGTVMEPLSIHLKFPNPMIHVFYAEGCSLAEAFYQSVGGPFQLMVAGDGLARPFANFPEVRLDRPAEPWTGTVTLAPKAKDATFELWVDGRFVTEGATLALDTTALADGWHDVRVVAIAADRIGSRTTVSLLPLVANHGQEVSFETKGARDATIGWEGKLVFTARGAKGIEVLCGSRVLARADGDRCEVAARDAGPGPVTLTPRAVLAGDVSFRGRPVEVTVLEAAPEVGEPGEGPRRPGLRARLIEGKEGSSRIIDYLGHRHGGTTLRDALKGTKPEILALSGELHVPAAGTWQLCLTGSGEVTVDVAGARLIERADLAAARFCAFTLPEGWHPLDIEVRSRAAPDLEVMLVGERELSPPEVRHATLPVLEDAPEIEGAGEDTPLPVPAEGLVLTWKRTQRDLAGVVLHAAEDAKDFPAEWIVETPVSRTKWKEVGGLSVAAATGKDGATTLVEVTFRPVRSKQLRIRPARAASTAEGPVTTVGRIEVLVAE